MDSPVYHYINGEKKSYIEYWNKNKGITLQDNHTPHNFDKLIKNFDPKLYNYEVKNLILINKQLIVLDGHHRICILKNAGIENIKVAICN